MISLIHVLIILIAGVILAVGCVLVGGWLMFKGRAAPGQGFFTEPKGEVFTIPEADGVGDFPGEPTEAEKGVLARTEQFLKTLGGK